jgi:hypothetical protein
MTMSMIDSALASVPETAQVLQQAHEAGLATNSIVLGQFAYLAIASGMTVWVARTLHTNGRAFLKDAFNGNEELAGSINKLLVVGFYLLNIGFVCIQVSDGAGLTNLPSIVRGYSMNVGWVMMVLGVMHMLNLYVFNRFRKSNLRHAAASNGGGMYRVAPVLPNYAVASEHLGIQGAVPVK